MENSNAARWFLGSNSGKGFFSLYDGFARGEGDFLNIIKGGPGGGKSGFMKLIGQAAEFDGLSVEYIHCSGDPDSLDGVYVPEKKVGWVDGTAPHIMDPTVFGADGAYFNLGAYCDAAAVRALAPELTEITREYRSRYDRAYALLSAAVRVLPGLNGRMIGSDEISAARKRAVSAAEHEFPKRGKKQARPVLTRRMLGGLTCRKYVYAESTLTGICERIYLLDDRFGLAAPYLDELMTQALGRGLDCVACPLGVAPDRLQAVIVPELSLGFVAAGHGAEFGFEPYRRIRLDTAVDAGRIREERSRIRADEKLGEAMIDAAADSLAEAKKLHDRLESLYNPFVDFEGVRTAATGEIIRWL